MPKKRNLVVLLVAVGVLMTTTSAKTEDGNSSAPEKPSDEETTALALEKEKEQLRKEIATLKKERILAEKGAQQALLPTSETSGPEGSVTLSEKGGYYAEVMAYRTLAKAAETIVNSIPSPTGQDPIAIVTAGTDFTNGSQLWAMVDAHLTDLEEKLTEAMKDAQAIDSVNELFDREEMAGALFSAAPDILGAAADVAAFFRTNLTITGRSVELAESALVAEISNRMVDAKTDTKQTWSEVIVPTLYLREKGPTTVRVEKLLKMSRDLESALEQVRKIVQSDLDALPDATTKLAAKGKDLTEMKTKLASKLNELAKLEEKNPQDHSAIAAVKAEIQRFSQAIDELSGEITKLEQRVFDLKRVKSEWEAFKSPIDELIKATHTYVDTLTKPDDDKPAPLLVLRRVDLILGHPNSTKVAADIVSQGAEVHVSKSAWKTRLSFFGGSVTTYFVIGPDNKLITSGTVPMVHAKSVKAKHSASLTNAP